MKLTLAVLQAALREHVDHDLASAMAGALATLRGDTVRSSSPVEDHEVGGLILRSLTFLVDPPPLELQFVTLETASDKLHLSAADAAEHPLLVGWLEPDAAGALSKPVIMGARRYDLSPVAPAIDSVSILTCATGCTAATYSRFMTRGGETNVIAKYGPDLFPPSLTRTIAMTGVSLARVGRAARAAAEVQPAPEPRVEPELVDVDLQPAGTVH